MLDDLKYACRRLWQTPGFTAIAVLTIALAIGANTAIFSIADAVLFRPLPYDDPDRVFVLRMLDRRTGTRFTLTPYEHLQAINDHHRTLSEVGTFEARPRVMTFEPGRVQALSVTAAYFRVLGVRPVRGRSFDDRDAVDRAALISYASWQQRFAGDEGVVGRAVTIGSTTVDVIGILPPGFLVPQLGLGRPDVYTLMAPPRPMTPGGTFHPIVRLERGATREQAQAEIESLVAPLNAASPRPRDVVPVLDEARSVLYPAGRPIARLLLLAAALVLVIGSANLGHMMLTRHQRVERELVIRAALGAGRVRVVRPAVLESLMLGIAGGCLAVVTTSALFDALLRQVPRVAYGNADVGVDARVVVFSLGLALVAGLVFAAVPAWRSSRLRAGSVSRPWSAVAPPRRIPGRLPVAIQVALAIVLVFGAGITGRALVAVLQVPLGFDPERVVTVDAFPANLEGEALTAFYLRAMSAIAANPDVSSVGVVGSLPLGGAAPAESVRSEGAGARVGIVHVLPGYVETAGIELVRGRAHVEGDVRSNRDAALVSRSAARVLFPGREALGETFTSASGRRFHVVGVIADVRIQVSEEPPPLTYVLPADRVWPMTIVARARVRQGGTLERLRQDVERAAGTTAAPVTAAWWADSIGTLADYRNPRFQTMILGAFAALALALTSIGVFGVVAFLVAARTHEMGVRLALGAAPRSLVSLMVSRVVPPVAAGLVLGLLATRWVSQLAEAQLFRIDARDPAMLVAAAVAVAGAAILAAYLPARRASGVDPVIALRAE